MHAKTAHFILQKPVQYSAHVNNHSNVVVGHIPLHTGTYVRIKLANSLDPRDVPDLLHL